MLCNVLISHPMAAELFLCVVLLVKIRRFNTNCLKMNSALLIRKSLFLLGLNRY